MNEIESGWTGPVELAARAAALTEAIRSGGTVPAGRLLGLPDLPDGGYWLDMAGAAAVTGVPPKTITGWLARGGPVRNPFPVPQRLLYRLFWRETEITSWQAKENSPVSRRSVANSGRTLTAQNPAQS